MDDREKIEEAHGLWELAVVRLAALAELIAIDTSLGTASFHVIFSKAAEDERIARKNWIAVSEEATAPPIVDEFRVVNE